MCVFTATVARVPAGLPCWDVGSVRGGGRIGLSRVVTSHQSRTSDKFFRSGAAFHGSGLDPPVGQRHCLGPRGSGARPPGDCRGGGVRGGSGRSRRFRSRPKRGGVSGVGPLGAPAFASGRWIISLKNDGFSPERWILA